MFESFSTRTNPPGMNLYLLNVNTGRTRLLAEFPPPGGMADDYLNGMGAFSPDGRALAYGFTPSAIGGTGVVFMSVANGEKIRSINISEAGAVPIFQWLSDGRLLVQGGNTGLETVSKTGTGARPINFHLWGYTQINTAVASPDGSEVAMQVDTGEGCGQQGPCDSAVYLAPMAGGTAKRLASAESQSGLVWSPDGRFLIYNSGPGTMKLMTVATRHTITIRPPKGLGVQGHLVGWRVTVASAFHRSLRGSGSREAAIVRAIRLHGTRARDVSPGLPSRPPVRRLRRDARVPRVGRWSVVARSA